MCQFLTACRNFALFAVIWWETFTLSFVFGFKFWNWMPYGRRTDDWLNVRSLLETKLIWYQLKSKHQYSLEKFENNNLHLYTFQIFDLLHWLYTPITLLREWDVFSDTLKSLHKQMLCYKIKRLYSNRSCVIYIVKLISQELWTARIFRLWKNYASFDFSFL